MVLECAPRAFCTIFHFDLQEKRPQLGASCGIWQSTASIYLIFLRKTTTFHPSPRHHLPELEAMSLLMLDWPRLFFEPRSKGLSADTEHAGNASHTGAFMIRTEYFFFFLFAPARAKMQHCTFIALFAPILRLPLSVLRDVTTATTIGDYFLYHRYIVFKFCISYGIIPPEGYFSCLINQNKGVTQNG